MVVGWALHSIKHRRLRCRLEHCNPLKKPTEKFEERKKYRQELMSVWMNSVSDDLDMVTDWIFFFQVYGIHGIDPSGGMYAQATLALLLVNILGSISYLFDLYQTVFKYPDTFKWLAPFTIFFEDVPQILLSLVLSGRIDNFKYDATPMAAFNIATSVYHAFIKVSSEVFVNFCYCCKFIPPEDEESRFVDGEMKSMEK